MRLAIDKTASRLRLALGMCSHRLNYYRHRVDCCHFGFWSFALLAFAIVLAIIMTHAAVTGFRYGLDPESGDGNGFSGPKPQD